MKRKLIITFLLIALIVIGLIVRIAVINYKDGSKYRKIVLGHQAYSTTVIPYMRGSILDRSGTVLAYSEKKYHLVLDASEITYNEKRRKTVIDTLTKYLDVTADEINAALDKDTTSKYQRFKRYLSYSEVSELIETVENDKIKGIYCAKISNISEAVLCRNHNDANVIAISADISDELAKSMVDKFIVTPFLGEEKYIRRIDMIKEQENKNG